MSNSNNYRWVHYSQIIPRNGWQFKEITGARGKVAWGYEKNIQVQGGNIENNDYEKLYFDVLLIPGQSDFVKIRVCFPWLRGNIIYGSAWFYDYCVMKMGFKDHRDKTVMTKHFHVEPENQCCNMADHSSNEEVASFYSDSFIPKTVFEELCKYKADRIKPDFIPIDIAITLRVHKGYRKDLFLPHDDFRFSFSSFWGAAAATANEGSYPQNHSVAKKKLRANSSTADVVFVMNSRAGEDRSGRGHSHSHSRSQQSHSHSRSRSHSNSRNVHASAKNQSQSQGQGQTQIQIQVTSDSNQVGRNNVRNRAGHESRSQTQLNRRSQSSEIITAHKAILMAHSPVFEKMFETNMRERETGLIEVKDDVSPSALRAFLDFIYDVPTETLIDDISLTLQVLQLAHKYQVGELIEFCVQTIIGNPNSAFSVKTAMDVVSAGTLYNFRDLKFRSAQWINRNKADLKPEEFRCLMEQFTQDEQLLFSCLRF